jgi:hypothetical protein
MRSAADPFRVGPYLTGLASGTSLARPCLPGEDLLARATAPSVAAGQAPSHKASMSYELDPELVPGDGRPRPAGGQPSLATSADSDRASGSR